MVTAIVSTVHHVLFSGKSKGAIVNIAMEIILLVSPDSILRTSDGSNTDEVTSIGKLDIVPGPSSGEGCSIHGGCASCPYMKTRLTISKGGDGTDDCNGDVLVVPDMIRYKTKSPGQGRAEQSRAEQSGGALVFATSCRLVVWVLEIIPTLPLQTDKICCCPSKAHSCHSNLLCTAEITLCKLPSPQQNLHPFTCSLWVPH